MENEIKKDYYRYTGTDYQGKICRLIKKNSGFAYMFFWRKTKFAHNKISKYIYRCFLHHWAKRTGIEIPLSVELGAGVLFLHPYSITMNSKTVAGKNLTVMKGATIGNTKGKNGGTPVIGDNVYIGLNSTVVGNISIGNNVMIAANTFVNFDVPDNSVVLGSPGILHLNKNTVTDYLVNQI